MSKANIFFFTPRNIFASQKVAANINLKVYIARGGDLSIRYAHNPSMGFRVILSQIEG